MSFDHGSEWREKLGTVSHLHGNLLDLLVDLPEIGLYNFHIRKAGGHDLSCPGYSCDLLNLHRRRSSDITTRQHAFQNDSITVRYSF